jgi:hypothetical protein
MVALLALLGFALARLEARHASNSTAPGMESINEVIDSPVILLLATR